MSSDNGVIVHKLLAVDHLDVQTLGIATINITNGQYDVDLPSVKPHTTNISLVVKSIESSLIALDWDLAASNSTTISSTSGKHIQLAAPSALSSSYQLVIPSYDAITDYTDRVVSVQSSSTDQVHLNFEDYNMVADPAVPMQNGNAFKFVTTRASSDDVELVFPNYTSGIDVTGFALAVDSVSTVAANHVTLSLSFMQLQNKPILMSPEKNEVRLLDPVSIATSSSTYQLPAIKTDTDYMNNLLLNDIDDTVGGVILNFDDSKLIATYMSFHPTKIVSASTKGIQNTMHMPQSIGDDTLHIGKILAVSSASASTYKLAYVDPGRVTSTTGHTVNIDAASNAIQHNLLFPAYNTPSVSRHVAVASDSGSQRSVQLHFAPHLSVHDSESLNESTTRIRSRSNDTEYTLFLPGNKQSTSFDSSFYSHVIGVANVTSSTIELAYLDPWLVNNTQIQMPDGSNNSYVLQLPGIDSSQNVNHYAGRVLQVVNKNNITLTTSFNKLDTFSNIEKLDLVNAAGHGPDIKGASSGSSYSFLLPNSIDAAVGKIIAIQSISTVSELTYTTSFAEPGMLRASQTGHVLQFVAPPSLAENFQLELPQNLSNVKVGQALTFKDNKLKFSYAASVKFASDSKKHVTIKTNNVEAAVSLVLPMYNGILNQNVGDTFSVHSHTPSPSESTLNLTFEKSLAIYSQKNEQKIEKSQHFTSLETASTQASDTCFTLPPTGGSGFVVVASQADYFNNADAANVLLDFNETLDALISDNAGNTIHFRGASSYTQTHELALPVFSREVHASMANVAAIVDARGVTETVRCAQTTVFHGITTYSANTSDGENHQLVVNPSQNIDGVTPLVGEAVLVAGQTNEAENGIYTVVASSTVMTLRRKPGLDTTSDLLQFKAVRVLSGISNIDCYFLLVGFFSSLNPVVGVDGMRFVKASSKENVVSLEFTSETHTPHLEVGLSGSETILSSQPRDLLQLVEIDEIVEKAGSRLLCVNSIENTHRSSKPTNHVHLASASGRQFLRLSSNELVALREEGVHFVGNVITKINTNLAFNWNEISASTTPCLNLVEVEHGAGIASSEHGLMCVRTGLYQLIINVLLSAFSTASVLSTTNSSMKIRLRTASGLADDSRSRSCQFECPDIEVFRQSSVVKQVQLVAFLNENETYFIEFRHNVNNINIANGAIRIDAATMLARYIS